MIKLSAVLILVLACSISWANSTQVRISALGAQGESILNSEVTRTEYRTETYPDTCYRSEFNGYREVCDSGQYVQECGTNALGEQICKDRWVPGACRQEPDYIDVPYTCYRERTISYQVKLYDVVSRVFVNAVAGSSAPSVIDEVLAVTLTQESIQVSPVRVSGKNVLSQKITSNVVQFDGRTKYIDNFIEITLGDKNDLLSPVIGGMKDLEVRGGLVTFTVGKVLRPDLFIVRADFRDKKIGDDLQFIERDLLANEIEIVDEGTRSRVNIDLQRLGILSQMKGKKVVFTTTASVKLDVSNIINVKDLPSLEIKSEVKQRM
jgi:hypothetical protein